MSKSVVICEGRRDRALLQYYLLRALSWSDVIDRSRQRRAIRHPGQQSRLLEKGKDELTIMSSGGAGNIHKALEGVLKRIKSTPPDGSDAYDNISVVTDRADDETEPVMLKKLSDTLSKLGASTESDLSNSQWIECRITTKTDIELSFRVQVLIIPFDENGAIETFLLEAVSRENAYDAEIVIKSKEFAGAADPEERYLTKRSYRTKAAFDAFFSIRTAPEQFNERQSVFLNVDWENYSTVNEAFKAFEEL